MFLNATLFVSVDSTPIKVDQAQCILCPFWDKDLRLNDSSMSRVACEITKQTTVLTWVITLLINKERADYEHISAQVDKMFAVTLNSLHLHVGSWFASLAEDDDRESWMVGLILSFRWLHMYDSSLSRETRTGLAQKMLTFTFWLQCPDHISACMHAW